MRSRTCAEHHIRPSFTSIFASLVNGCESKHSLYQWPSQVFIEYEERRIVCGCPKTRQLVSGWIWSSRFTCEALFTSLSSRTCVDKMAERSHDRSSSAESQPKFPGCSHFRRRNDNHLHCQQCRLNEGQPLCTQDRPCLVCKDWLPEAWAAQAKANAQKNRCKAAAAAKAAKKASEETMDDSLEIHAPEEALQLPSKRAKSEGSSKMKRTKTTTSSGSSQPKSVASSVSAMGRPSSHGSDHRRSRSPECKRRHGDDKLQDSPRPQSSRRDGHSSGQREGERSRPSSSGSSSSRRRAESGSVSKASDTRPSASSSHHHHRSSGDRRSLSSTSSRASPDLMVTSQSPLEKTREHR